MKSIFQKMLFIFALFSLCSCSQKNPIDASYAYLKKHGQCPKEYVISKFEQYDYVFLGEPHWLKQDADFVTSLIPELYNAGVRNLAIEFYNYQDQAIVDSLLVAKEWSETLLYQNISSGYGILWGYAEYLNIFKKTWEFNQTLKSDQPKFRIVLLSVTYNPCKEGIEIFGGHDPDVFMTEIFEKEIILKQEKGLAYCGAHHAFTKYQQPIYDFEKNTLYRMNDGRFGNVTYEKYPEKTFNIVLHYPWTSNEGWDKPCVKPVNGVIDAVMERLGNRPMGFDAKGTIMGQLRADDTYYAFGYKNFKLEDFCDGYIFLVPYKDAVYVSPEPSFYDEFNLERLRRIGECMKDNPEIAETAHSKETAIKMIAEIHGTADQRFGHLRE